MELQIADYLKTHKELKPEAVLQFFPTADPAELQELVARIKGYRKKLKKLLEQPLIKQKTEAWYNLRQGLITASDFAQALGEGKFGTQRELIAKKVKPSNEPMKSNPFFEWGNMFEPVATAIYEHMHHVRIYEFGLIPHPTHTFFGASPDGISNLGIMLEIKCPMKRKLTGDIPLQYYYQIQGQLDVCELDECDYFECELQRWSTYEEYQRHYIPGSYTGWITQAKSKECSYGLPQLHLVPRLPPTSPSDTHYYWMLVKHNEVRVHRDRAFLAKNIPKLKEVWDRILHYRANEQDYVRDILKKITLDTECFHTGAADTKPETPPIQLSKFSFVPLS